MSLRCNLFVSDMNQRNIDFGCKKVGSRFLVWPQGRKGSP